MTDAEPKPPLDALGVIAVQEKAVTPSLDHVEMYTMEGLVTLLWHGPRDAHDVVLMCGGAMGGLLGPADGLFHDLGGTFAALGIGTIRVGYRRPNDLDRCVMDVAAAADVSGRVGGRRFVVVGHSFGGAVAVNTGRRAGPARGGRRRAGDAVGRLRDRRAARGAAAARARRRRRAAAPDGQRGGADDRRPRRARPPPGHRPPAARGGRPPPREARLLDPRALRRHPRRAATLLGSSPDSGREPRKFVSAGGVRPRRGGGGRRGRAARCADGRWPPGRARGAGSGCGWSSRG